MAFKSEHLRVEVDCTKWPDVKLINAEGKDILAAIAQDLHISEMTIKLTTNDVPKIILTCEAASLDAFIQKGLIEFEKGK